jgi:hypothetical protein
MKYLANFKKVVLICVKNRWLPGDPFINFKLTKKTVEKVALTERELLRTIEKKFAFYTDKIPVSGGPESFGGATGNDSTTGLTS